MRIVKIICCLLAIGILFPAGASWSAEELLIGLIPDENIFDELSRFRLVADYVERRTGIRMRLTILSRYGDVIDRFSSRNMDGAFFGAFTGVLAIEKLKVSPIARPVALDGHDKVQSVIFVRTGSGIKTARDMQGRSIVFTDRATITGYLFARAWLHQRGVPDIEKHFREVHFTGNHDSVIYAVLDNRADVGVAKSKQFNKMLAKDPTVGQELDVLVRSDPFPDLTLCLRQSLPAETRSRIRDALLGMEMDKEGKEVLRQALMQRFVAASLEDFAPVYDVARTAGVTINTYRYK